MTYSVFDRQAAWARRRPEDQLDANTKVARSVINLDGEEPGVRTITDVDEVMPN